MYEGSHGPAREGSNAAHTTLMMGVMATNDGVNIDALHHGGGAVKYEREGESNDTLGNIIIRLRDRLSESLELTG